MFDFAPATELLDGPLVRIGFKVQGNGRVGPGTGKARFVSGLLRVGNSVGVSGYSYKIFRQFYGGPQKREFLDRGHDCGRDEPRAA